MDRIESEQFLHDVVVAVLLTDGRRWEGIAVFRVGGPAAQVRLLAVARVKRATSRDPLRNT